MAQDVLTLTDSDFEQQVIKAAKPVLVDFWAEWCAPCRALSSVVEDVAKQYAAQIHVGKMNIDDHPNAPSKYGVQAIPTLLIFKNGDVADKIVGLVAKAKIEDVIKKYI